MSPRPSFAPFVLIDEALVPAERACVSVEDRGFLYGDAVYETLRAYRGRAFLLDRHLERLRRSAAALYLPLPWSDAELAARLARLLDANGTDDGRIRITVTRGRGRLRARPEDMTAPTLVMTAEADLGFPAALRAEGVAVEIARRVRNHPDALDPAIKSANLLNTLLARFEMNDPDAFEVLLPNQRGELTEGALSNLFAVDAGGRLRTPALASGLLPGITRSLVLDLAREAGLNPQETSLLPAELLGAREAFLTGSTIEILGIRSVDGRRIGGLCPGPVTAELARRYRERVEAFCRGAGP